MVSYLVVLIAHYPEYILLNFLYIDKYLGVPEVKNLEFQRIHWKGKLKYQQFDLLCTKKPHTLLNHNAAKSSSGPRDFCSIRQKETKGFLSLPPGHTTSPGRTCGTDVIYNFYVVPSLSTESFNCNSNLHLSPGPFTLHQLFNFCKKPQLMLTGIALTLKASERSVAVWTTLGLPVPDTRCLFICLGF